MVKETLKIRKKEERYEVVKPLGIIFEGGVGFRKFGKKYDARGLVNFLENNWKNKKRRIIGSLEIAEDIKEVYRGRAERKENYLKQYSQLSSPIIPPRRVLDADLQELKE